MTAADRALRDLDPAQRAAFTLSTITGSGGLLPDEKANQFVTLAVNDTPLLRFCRIERMNAPTKKIPKIAFGGRIIRTGPGDDTALGSSSRAAPTPSEVSLTAKEYVAHVPIGYGALEDNVELDALEATIMSEASRQWGVDMEGLALSSDTTEADSTLVAHGYAQQDGWLKLVSTNVVNASNAYIGVSLMESARITVASKYRRTKMHKFFVGEKAANKWRTTVSDRQTVAGDQALTSVELPLCGGTPVVEAPNLPVATGTPDTAPALFCDPQNLIMGVRTGTLGAGGGGVSMKMFDEPLKGVVTLIIRTKVAFAVMHEAAAAKVTNLRA